MSAHEKSLMFQSTNFDWQARVLGLNTRGALIHLDQRDIVKVGQNVGGVDVMIDNQQIARIPTVLIRQTTPTKTGAIVGVLFHTSTDPAEAKINQILGRNAVAPVYGSQVCAPSPIDSTEMMKFNVRYISNSGMILTTSLRNRALLPGMVISKAHAQMGEFADFEFDMILDFVALSEDASHLVCHAHFSKISDQASQRLNGFLITNQRTNDDSSLSSRTGSSPRVPTGSLEKLVRYTQASSLQHILDVQMQRWRCRQGCEESGLLELLPMETLDVKDRHSHVLLGYIGQDLVSSARIRAIDGDGQSQTNKMLLDRVYVNPKLHGTTITAGILQFAVSWFRQTDATCLVTKVKPDEIALMMRLGFTLNSNQHQPNTNSCTRDRTDENGFYEMILDRHSHRHRANPSLLIKLYSWARLHEFLIERKYVRDRRFQSTQLAVLRRIAAALQKRLSPSQPN